MNRLILIPVTLLFLLYASPFNARAQEDRVLLAIFGHPDDEIFVSPILARYAREGADVHLVLATRGEKWAPETDLEPGDEIAEVRAGEVRCSAAALGVNPPILLPFGDGSLGEPVREGPPWETLAQLEGRLAKILKELRPDVVVTHGPEGAYGHPDHRLVGAVLTQMVQRRAEGAPSRLLYVGFPSERLPAEGFGLEMPWQPTASEYLTVRVAYTDADFDAARRAFACHESQFPPMMLQAFPQRLHELVWQGQVFFRPWFGAVTGDDLFTLPSIEGN